MTGYMTHGPERTPQSIRAWGCGSGEEGKQQDCRYSCILQDTDALGALLRNREEPCAAGFTELLAAAPISDGD